MFLVMFTHTDKYGNWSNQGCNETAINSTLVICECNHLTSFAILLVSNIKTMYIIFVYIFQDVSPTVKPTEKTGLTLFLDSVTYIGIIVSLCCLTVTVISYICNK